MMLQPEPSDKHKNIGESKTAGSHFEFGVIGFTFLVSSDDHNDQPGKVQDHALRFTEYSL